LFPTPPSLPGAEEQAQPSQLSEAERARLEGIRGEIQAEVAQQIEAYQRAKRERAVLTRILKQNLLKVFMKKVIETQKWISLDPKNLLSNIGEQVTPDSLKIMDRIFQKHDTSHDAEIISSMKAEVDRLQAEMNEHIGNVRDLRQEISRLDQRMGR
jgi:predicted  nucleic acid-binding Zn-ribbon protein